MKHNLTAYISKNPEDNQLVIQLKFIETIPVSQNNMYRNGGYVFRENRFLRYFRVFFLVLYADYDMDYQQQSNEEIGQAMNGLTADEMRFLEEENNANSSSKQPDFSEYRKLGIMNVINKFLNVIYKFVRIQSFMNG